MPREVADEDEQGLTLVERQLLTEIAMTGSWQKAAHSLGMDKRKVRALMKRDAFKREYDKLFSVEAVAATAKELTLISENAGDIYEEAVKAELEKKFPVTCEECGHKQTVLVKVMDWPTKLRAIETVLKIARVIKDERSLKVEADIQITHVELTTGEYLALERLHRGMPVPDYMYYQLEEKLKGSGQTLPPLPEGGGPRMIEGEFHEVKKDEDRP